MSHSFDLLPTDRQVGLPRHVTDDLVELGTACNDAALLVSEAELLAQRASAAEERHGSAVAEDVATAWVRATISYSEQLIVTYTGVAARYAAFAAAVAAAVADGSELVDLRRADVVPSAVVRSAAALVPLVRVGAGGSGNIAAEHDRELVTSHRHLLEVAAHTCSSHPPELFDGQLSVASRPRGAIDIGGELATALHRYAAACVWSLGLHPRLSSMPSISGGR